MEELSEGLGVWSSFVNWNFGEIEPRPRPLPPPPAAPDDVEKGEVEEEEMKEGLVVVERYENFEKLLLMAVALLK